MLSAGFARQLEDYVLQAGSLRRRPMDSSGGVLSRYCGYVDDEVLNLSPKDVGSTIWQRTARLILGAVNDPEPIEIRSCLQDGQTVGIPDQVCCVVAHDGRREKVGPSREIHNCISRAARGTSTGSTPVPITDSALNRGAIIRRPISASCQFYSSLILEFSIPLGTVVLHVPINLVGFIGIESRDALMTYSLIPVGTSLAFLNIPDIMI